MLRNREMFEPDLKYRFRHQSARDKHMCTYLFCIALSLGVAHKPFCSIQQQVLLDTTD